MKRMELRNYELFLEYEESENINRPRNLVVRYRTMEVFKGEGGKYDHPATVVREVVVPIETARRVGIVESWTTYNGFVKEERIIPFPEKS